MRRWVSAIVFSVVLWVAVPYTRALSDALRERAWLIPLTGMGAVLCVGGMIRVWKRLLDHGHRWRLAGSIAIAVLYAVLAYAVVIQPEERFHFFAMGFLCWLWFRAFDQRVPGARVAVIYAGLCTAFVGVTEETIQLWTPGRVFDWRDIGMNVAAAALSAGWIGLSRYGFGSRRVAPKPRVLSREAEVS